MIFSNDKLKAKVNGTIQLFREAFFHPNESSGERERVDVETEYLNCNIIFFLKLKWALEVSML